MKNLLIKMLNKLGVNTEKVDPIILTLHKREDKPIGLEIKELKTIIKTTFFTIDDLEQTLTTLLSEENLTLDDLLNKFFGKRVKTMYTDYYIIQDGNYLVIEKRDNNWLLQGLYKGADKKELTDYVSFYGTTILTGTNPYVAIADVVDLIGDHSLTAGLYNYWKGKKIDADISGQDLSLIKAQYKRVINDYQDILNSFRSINNKLGVNFEEVLYGSEKTILENSDYIPANLTITSSLEDSKGNFNTLIALEGNILELADKFRKTIKDFTINKATIINITTITFVKKFYLIEVFKYKADVDEIVELYNNREGLVALVEEKLAESLHADTRLKSQWEALRKRILNID